MGAVVDTRPQDEQELVVPDGYELVDGRLVEKPVSEKSSWVGGQVFGLLWTYCRAHGLGCVWPADNGYRCFPDRPRLVRKPDVSFISRGRLPAGGLHDGDTTIAPDLAVEIVSPNDLAEDVAGKIRDYLAVGVRLVWEVYPEVREVRVHRDDGSVSKLRDGDELSGEEILPGFRCTVRDFLPPAADEPAPRGAAG
jgi:Uma2 family endonuclease